MIRLRLVFAATGALAGLVSLAAPASATASCPAWTTPVCRQYSCTGPIIGGTCSCVRWECVADKKSDPPKRQSVMPGQRSPGVRTAR